MSELSLHQRIEQYGNLPFLITDQGTYSYADIGDNARKFATRLRQLGIRKGDTIAILAGNSAAYIAAWFGTVMCGAIAATLNNLLISDGLCYTLKQCECSAIVADSVWVNDAYHHLSEDLKTVPMIVFNDEVDFFVDLRGFSPATPEPVSASDPSTILYTSGTTGLPKGVVNSHSAYFASGAAAARLLGITKSDRIMVFLPMFHVNPQMMGIMCALSVGASIALRPRFSASTFFEDAKRLEVTGCTYVGTILAILTKRYLQPQRDHQMRFCFGGGAPAEVWTAVEERFGMTVHEAYGMTELGGWTAANSSVDRRFSSCGHVRDDIEVRIVDEFDNEVMPGTKGEIVGRPRMPNVILSGYWNKPDKFVEATRNLWFHSGDLGYFDEDGFLYYDGRIKDLIRRGGEMVSPIELETRLLGMSGIVDCAIVGVPDPIMDEEVKVVIVTHAAINPLEVVAFLKSHFPAYMLPRYVEFVDRIPKTANEKVQRHLLKYVSPPVIDLRSDR
jgi:acyl-CoA synthetase (AMP-forming)/AMP-acid ligase II